MSDLREEDDQMTGDEVCGRLAAAMQAAEEWYISRGDEAAAEG